MRDGDRSRVRLIVIAGPTAVGKTAVGVELAIRLGGEIISADSMAIYRGMDIGTAKPTPEEKAKARFHLIDVVEPDQPFTVRDFARQAIPLIQDCIARGAYPILLGGTGLYIRAVVDGLDIPEAGPNIELRERLASVAEQQGNEAVYAQLAEVDAETAARLHPNDLKRVIRALEVYELTGMPMSQLHNRPKPEPNYPDAELFGLEMERKTLYDRIEARIDEQIRLGFVREVENLLQKGYNEKMPSMQGLGYKEIAGHLRGEYDFETALYLLKRNVRRFAKRQFTWFRADTRIRWLSVQNIDAVAAAESIVGQIRNGAIEESPNE